MHVNTRLTASIKPVKNEAGSRLTDAIQRRPGVRQTLITVDYALSFSDPKTARGTRSSLSTEQPSRRYGLIGLENWRNSLSAVSPTPCSICASREWMERLSVVVSDGPPKPVVAHRFHASTKLNPAKLAGNAGQVGEEIVQHLNALRGADVEVTIEVHATVPDGIPESIVRTVSENARTLKFESWGFEEE